MFGKLSLEETVYRPNKTKVNILLFINYTPFCCLPYFKMCQYLRHTVEILWKFNKIYDDLRVLGRVRGLILYNTLRQVRWKAWI